MHYLVHYVHEYIKQCVKVVRKGLRYFQTGKKTQLSIQPRLLYCYIKQKQNKTQKNSQTKQTKPPTEVNKPPRPSPRRNILRFNHLY